jgi:tRNA (mo5U34)-methyltransferase
MQPNGPLSYIQDWHRQLDASGWWHSFELPDGGRIEGVSKLEAQRMRIGQFPIPQDLRGKRVLDIGTWDGWFAMEMERRGADVVAIDRWDNPRFHEIHDLLGSRIEYRQMSVYDLDPGEIGQFDVVLFMGVLYHLKHPLLALERVCAVARDMVAVESFVLRDKHAPGLGVEERPLMEFYEGTEFGGEFDNWVAPTVKCLEAFCRTAGFARVDLENVHDFGAALTCYRKWLPPSGPLAAPLKMVSAFHAELGGMNFNSRASDEYVGCRMEGSVPVAEVFPEVSGFGSRPVFVGAVDGGWQVNFKLPPGLPAGWHKVRLRTAEAESNSVEIAVDVSLQRSEIEIRSVCDAVDWTPLRVSLRHGFLSLWVDGLPRNADTTNVKIRVGGKLSVTTFVGGSQVNVRLAPRTPTGAQMVEMAVGAAHAAAKTIAIVE